MVHYRNWAVGRAKAHNVRGWVANGGDKSPSSDRGANSTGFGWNSFLPESFFFVFVVFNYF